MSNENSRKGREKKGVFITFEGLDGSGKSTQIEFLKDYLKSKGEEVVLTREPGGTVISEKIRGVILDIDNSEMTDLTELLMFYAARAQHISQVILPNIRLGKIVICDRFKDSSYVYQGYGKGLFREVAALDDILDEIEPDITFLLHMDAKNSLARIDVANADRIEVLEGSFHDRVELGYKALSEKKRVFLIDAKLSIDEIRQLISDKIDEYLS